MNSSLNLSPRCWVHSCLYLVFFVFFIFFVLIRFVQEFFSFCIFLCLICFFTLVFFLGCFRVKPRFLDRFMIELKISGQPGLVNSIGLTQPKKNSYIWPIILKTKWSIYFKNLKYFCMDFGLNFKNTKTIFLIYEITNLYVSYIPDIK